MQEKELTLVVIYQSETICQYFKTLLDNKLELMQSPIKITVMYWPEAVWLENKQAGNFDAKLLFLGEIKEAGPFTSIIPLQFSEYGIRYGWTVKHAIVAANTKALTIRQQYEMFLKKFNTLDVPDSFKVSLEEPETSLKLKKITPVVDELKQIKYQLQVKFEEVLRDKTLMYEQMMLYGIYHFMDKGIQRFLEQ